MQTITAGLRKTAEAYGEANLKNRNLANMSANDLWRLREEVGTILSTKLGAEKQKLELRLARLNGRLEPKQGRVDPTPRFIQNIVTRRGPLKLGLDEGNNRAG